MKARLLCKLGELKGSEFDIDSEATIGRSESNSIVLGSRSISSRHARIFTDDAAGHFVIEDLGSRNGTRLDGRTLRGREQLGGLHVVNFGRSADFVFVVVPEREVAEETPTPQAAAPPTAEAEPSERSARSVSSTVVEVEPLPLPASLATSRADGATDGPDRVEEDERKPPRRRSGQTLVEHDSPELPEALRGDPDPEERPGGGG